MKHTFTTLRRALALTAALAAGCLGAQAQNVGIGTTTPTQKLDVNGSLRVRGLSGTDNRLPMVMPDGTLGVNAPVYGTTATAPAFPTAAAGSVATGNYPQSVVVSGTTAYVVNQSGSNMQVFDVATPSAPVLLGSVTTDISPQSVAVSGTTAYVVSSGTNNLQVFNVATPSAPVLLGSVNTGASSFANSVAVSGTTAYVVCSNSGNLQVYDVATPSAPVLLGSVNTGAAPQSVAVSGTTAYVVNFISSTLQAFNVATPSAPVLLGQVATGSNPVRVAVSGTTAYVVNKTSNTLQAFNVATPSAPVLLGSVATGTAPFGVAVSGTTAYVVNRDVSTLQAFNVATPSAPVLLGTVATGSSPQSVAVSGTTAYVTNAGSNTLQAFTFPGPPRTVAVNSDGSFGSVALPSGADFIQNGTAQQATSNYNISGTGTVGGLLTAGSAAVTGTTTTTNAVVTTALTGSGASIGTAVGVGIRADGGLNLGQNTIGKNVYLGYRAGENTTSLGIDNHFIGYQAGLANTSGNTNFFEGSQAGGFNTTGSTNLAIGYLAGQQNQTGINNFQIGAQAGRANTVSANHFVGFYAGTATTTGSRNTFEGNYAGVANNTGGNNTFLGYEVGKSSVNGDNNTLVGYQAGLANTSGSNNTALGYNAGPSTGALTNATAIGYNASVSQSNSLVLGNGASVGIGTTAPTQKLEVAGTVYSTSGGFKFPDGTTQTTAASPATGTNFIQNQTTQQAASNFNVSGSGTVGGTLRAANAVVTTALTGTGADLGTVVGVGIRADGGLNLGQNTAGNNLYVGYYSGQANTTGSFNQFSGYLSGARNTTGSSNVFSGAYSGYFNTTGNNNNFNGFQSGYINSTGSNNHFSGYNSGQYNTTGSNNTALGSDSGPANGSGALTNATAIGSNASVSQSNSLVLGNNASVGIGTSAPTQKLEVAGTVYSTSGGFKFPDGTTQTTAAAATNLTGDITSTGAATTYNNVVPATKGGAGTVSGLLKANGSGTVNAAVAGTDYAAATGSAAYIQNGTGAQATSNFNISGAGTVGGLLTAGSATVTGNIQSSANIAVDAGNGNTGTVANTLRFGPTNSGEAIGSKRTATGNQFGLDFYTTSTARMSITTGGDVGIGTTAPLAKLAVAGAQVLYSGLNNASARPAVDLARIPGEIAGVGQVATATPTLNADDGFLRLSAGGGGTLARKSYIDLSGFSNNADMNENIVFGTINAERMRIIANGSVGIGTTAPIQLLDVATGGVRVGGSGAFTAVSATNQGAHLQWNRSLGDGETWLINHMGSGRPEAGIRFAGITTSTGTTPTEWARFLNNGNFGIGTIAPGYPLQLGNATTNGGAYGLLQGVFGQTNYLRHSRLMLNDTNFGMGAGAMSATVGDDDLYFYAYNAADRDIRFMHTDNGLTNPSGAGWTTDLIIKQGGNVGIGNPAPATKLDVNGNLRLAVRLCPVNTASSYTLVAADIAFSIFKTQIGNAVSTITLPSSIGQVEGQELTIINASDINVTVNGSTDNGGGVTLPNANGPGIHAVKYVWATYSGGTGAWFRVQ